MDQTSFGAATVAHALDLPFVSVSCALLLNSEPAVPPVNTSWRYQPTAWARLRNRLGRRLLTQVVIDYRQQHHLPVLTDSAQAWSPLAQICQQPADFEYPRHQLPAWFHFTGPLVDPASRAAVPFPWEALNGKPLIYASLGTIQNQQLEVFARIAEACAHLNAELVIALGGGGSPEALPALPGDPLVVGFAPQLALLQRAAITITHAGLNTVLESLRCGVPMVAFPIANDQPGVAARVAWSGSGAVVPLKRAWVPRLRAAIERVWGDPSYRQNAQRLQQLTPELAAELAAQEEVLFIDAWFGPSRRGTPGHSDRACRRCGRQPPARPSPSAEPRPGPPRPHPSGAAAAGAGISLRAQHSAVARAEGQPGHRPGPARHA